MLIVSADARSTEMPTERLAADCVLTDEAGRLLVLDPPYTGTWDIPGGIVEVDESPRQAAQREVREEIGLDLEARDLLVVDWKPRDGDISEVVALLFDGGTVTAGTSVGSWSSRHAVATAILLRVRLRLKRNR